jgi:hypothetical protein
LQRFRITHCMQQMDLYPMTKLWSNEQQNVQNTWIYIPWKNCDKLKTKTYKTWICIPCKNCDKMKTKTYKTSMAQRLESEPWILVMQKKKLCACCSSYTNF